MQSADADKLLAELRALEATLLQHGSRKNAELVRSLLTQDFHEIGGSGRVYTRDEVVRMLAEEAPTDLAASDFTVRLLLRDVALLTYLSLKSIDGGAPAAARRSSLWVRQAQGWRMCFHQATPIAEAPLA